jgi:hypothetical protein
MIQQEVLLMLDTTLAAIMVHYSIQAMAVLGSDLSVQVVLQFLQHHLVILVAVRTYPAGLMAHFR